MNSQLPRIVQLLPLFAVLGAVLLQSQDARADLREAYQREIAFLEAEKNTLASRLKQLEAESNEKVSTARAEVDQLQGAVLGLSLQADRMTEMLSDVERQAESANEGDDVIETTLTQMATTLEKGGVELPAVEQEDEEARIKQLRFAFEKALPLLDQFGRVREESGKFFTAGGDTVEGKLIHLGQIASFGVSEKTSGTLAPAGAGRLKIWPGVESANTAQALAAGNDPGRLHVFLYESLEKGVEKRKDKTPVEVIDSGGVIGWVIVAAGLVALLMAILRAFLLFAAAANTTSLVEKITPLLEQRKISDAIDVCKKAKNAGGRVLTATLKHLDSERDELEDIITEAILHEQPALDRFGSAIVVIAAVAPLLGLLGTVTGMIATFDIITEFGTGNPKLLSGGIAIALVTTELGLIVAIPALVIGNMLGAWSEGIKDGIDKAALRVINIATGVRLSQRPSVPPADDRKSLDEALPAT